MTTTENKEIKVLEFLLTAAETYDGSTNHCYKIHTETTYEDSFQRRDSYYFSKLVSHQTVDFELINSLFRSGDYGNYVIGNEILKNNFQEKLQKSK